MSSFAVGDVVSLKSGGSALTVLAIDGDAIRIFGYDGNGQFIDANVPGAALIAHAVPAHLGGDRGAAPGLTSIDALLKTPIPPGVTTEVLPETRVAAIEMVAHLLRTGLNETSITLWDLTYADKPIGDIEIVIRRKR